MTNENGYEQQLQEARDNLRLCEERLRHWMQKTNDAREQVRHLSGPFEPGQVVRVPGNGRMNEAVVLAVDKAFGDWVVKVTFDHGGREYIYPANVVEAA